MSKQYEIPEIRIKNAWLLRGAASVPMNELWGNGEPLESDEYYGQRTERYRKAWQPYEQKILQGMCDVLDLEFNHNIIDVYVAPWFRAFSDPLVVGVRYNDNEFVEVLAHELFHRLLTDNTKVDNEKYWESGQWKKLFGKGHSLNTLVHIPVMIGLKSLYLDVLHEPKRLDHDIAFHDQFPDYKLAWEYVQQRDYEKLLADLKESYNQPL